MFNNRELHAFITTALYIATPRANRNIRDAAKEADAILEAGEAQRQFKPSAGPPPGTPIPGGRR